MQAARQLGDGVVDREQTGGGDHLRWHPIGERLLEHAMRAGWGVLLMQRCQLLGCEPVRHSPGCAAPPR